MIQSQRRAQSVFIILGACLSLATFACQLQLGGPKPPSAPAETPAEASTPLEQAWASAVDAAGQTGEISLTIDEAQLNGLVQEKLEAEVNPTILQPQVFLRQGQIQLYGISTQGPVRARIHVSIQPKADAEGRVQFEIPAAEFGPFPAPQALKDAVSRSISELFAGTLGPLAVGFRVISVDISDGQMAIVATIR